MHIEKPGLNFDTNPYTAISWPLDSRVSGVGFDVLKRDNRTCTLCGWSVAEIDDTVLERLGGEEGKAWDEGENVLHGYNSSFLQLGFMDSNPDNIKKSNLYTVCGHCQIQIMPLSAVVEKKGQIIVNNTHKQSFISPMMWTINALLSMRHHRYQVSAQETLQKMLGTKSMPKQATQKKPGYKPEYRKRKESSDTPTDESGMSPQVELLFLQFPFLKSVITDLRGDAPFKLLLTVLIELDKKNKPASQAILNQLRIVPIATAFSEANNYHAKTIFHNQENITAWQELSLQSNME